MTTIALRHRNTIDMQLDYFLMIELIVWPAGAVLIKCPNHVGKTGMKNHTLK